MDEISAWLEDEWKSVRVEAADARRTLRISDGRACLKGYDGEVWQIAIARYGKIKPALIITNDFATTAAQLIRIYTRWWLVEKEISKQI